MTMETLSGLDMPPHSCEVMGISLDDKRIPIEYQPTFRAYVLWIEKPDENDSGMAQELFFCPWCGDRLPSSLSEQLYEELSELNDGCVDDFQQALDRAPANYHTSAWWQGRYDWNGARI